MRSLLQEKALVNWRCGYANTWNFEIHPNETIIWARFVEHGLAVPTSDFFRGILDYYGIQLVHLNPNGILHISIFVHLCEVYLGIQPHFKLFRSDPQPSQDNMSALGGAGFQLRDSDLYLEFETSQSHGRGRTSGFTLKTISPQCQRSQGTVPSTAPNGWMSRLLWTACKLEFCCKRLLLGRRQG